MDFQMLLLKVGKALNTEEVKALAFLCTDLLGRNPANVDSAADLFSRLTNRAHLSPEEPHLLTELLHTIHHPRLARDLGLGEQPCTVRIPPYRKLLYSLSEDITADELRDIKFLLNKELPRRKLEDNVTTLEVFLEMEHTDMISSTHLNTLETIFESVCPMLNNTIAQFKAQHEHSTGIIAQETCQPNPTISLSHQGSQTLLETGLNEMIEESHSSATTSMNSVLDCSGSGGHESEALASDVCSLNINSNSSASLQVRSDLNTSVPSQENMTSSEQQIPQVTTNDEDLGTYPMTAAKRGVCLIVNNKDFTKSRVHLKNRTGTDSDERYLRIVFEWLSFDVEVHKDCNKEKMLDVVRKLSERDHSQADCVVCCVLSHGLEGSVFGVDGDVVNLRDLMEPFNGCNCPSLTEKPKLFFIQACQGTSEQRAIYLEADSSGPNPVCSDALKIKESIPADADFLLGMATVPEFVSYRDKISGTWYIQSFCQNLIQMVPRKLDLISILTKVNADVSRKTAGKGKQMPQPAFSLRKRVVFPVPKIPPPIIS
ncbi:caspase-8 isoform X2 [Parambassis ranga]|nr:caspase-8-like isoform X2 [Parambassis ranga]XP_028249389.1 caspase-8-like isoform X2 [Parambassis ranga]XP_028249391.1 caspase-8-like isoform X2 [Parambassis ranga]